MPAAQQTPFTNAAQPAKPPRAVKDIQKDIDSMENQVKAYTIAKLPAPADILNKRVQFKDEMSRALAGGQK